MSRKEDVVVTPTYSTKGADPDIQPPPDQIQQVFDQHLARLSQPLPDDAQRLLRRLIARQMELERRNEALARTQLELRQHVEERMAELQLANQALQQEIVERQQAEASLRESERRFRRIFEHAAVGMAQLSPDGDWQRVNDRLCDITGYSREEMLRLNFKDITHPDDVETNVEMIRRGFAGEMDTFPLEKRYIRKDGTVAWVRVTVAIVRSESGEARHFISVTEDITERRRIQQREREQRELAEALRRTTAALVRQLELDDVLEQIIVSLDRVVPHDAVSITLIRDGALHTVRSRGFERDAEISAVRSLELPAGQLEQLKQVTGISGPLILRDVKRAQAWPDIPNLRWVNSYLGAPILLDQSIIGFIHLMSKEAGFFTAPHADRLQAFADSVAIAIRNAQLYEQVEELAATKERQRIANDLHDAVSQTLFSANMIADALPYLWEKTPEAVPAQLGKLRERTASALAEMRALLLELRPLEMEHIELSRAIAQLVQSVNGRMKVPVTLEVSGECSAEIVPTDIKVAFYRIAQEALNNVSKHASTECAGVTLSCDGGVLLSVWDEGNGFDVQSIPPGHMGVRIMRERAEAVGAAFSLVSRPGSGTQVTVKWSPPARKLESHD